MFRKCDLQHKYTCINYMFINFDHLQCKPMCKLYRRRCCQLVEHQSCLKTILQSWKGHNSPGTSILKPFSRTLPASMVKVSWCLTLCTPGHHCTMLNTYRLCCRGKSRPTTMSLNTWTLQLQAAHRDRLAELQPQLLTIRKCPVTPHHTTSACRNYCCTDSMETKAEKLVGTLEFLFHLIIPFTLCHSRKYMKKYMHD